jgi:hypothetical protein
MFEYNCVYEVENETESERESIEKRRGEERRVSLSLSVCL